MYISLFSNPFFEVTTENRRKKYTKNKKKNSANYREMDVNFIRRGRNIDNFLSLLMAPSFLLPSFEEEWARKGTPPRRGPWFFYFPRGEGIARTPDYPFVLKAFTFSTTTPLFCFTTALARIAAGAREPASRCIFILGQIEILEIFYFRFGIERFVIVINYSQRRRFEPFTLGFERYLFTIDLFYHISRSVERYIVE